MLRIVSMLHAYPPYHNAGAETMLHQVHRWLAARGHSITVTVRDPSAGTWEGIPVKRRGPLRWLTREIEGAVVFTHLDETPIAEAVSRDAGRPLVHFLHNDKQLQFHGVTYAAHLVPNTKWLDAAAIPDHLAAVPRTIVHPPTFCADYPTDARRRDSIALVNLLEGKGAPLFYRLARQLTDRRFLAVTGAYGPQIPPPTDLDNLAVRPNRPNMVGVWDRTRILLAPSVYESYGKAAVEALASGIPVIAHPTPGLLESLGDAGIFADRDDTDAWASAIADLDNPANYRRASEAARARALELEAITVAQLEALEAGLEALA